MKASSWFVSLLLFLSLHCAAQSADSVSLPQYDMRQYNMGIEARGNRISGIALMEPSDDGGTVGTIVNEFGVKVLDFTCRQGKTKIMNVIAPLNKWYIRKVLRKDLGVIISSVGSTPASGLPTTGTGGKNRTIVRNADGGLTLRNQRFNIVYTLSPIKESIQDGIQESNEPR